MEFIKIAQTSEITPGNMKIVSLGGQEVLLANVSGQIYAKANRCPHLGGSLGEGTLQGNIVTCPRHGSQFDITTGKNIRRAKIAFLKIPVKDTVTYQVRIEGADILVGKE